MRFWIYYKGIALYKLQKYDEAIAAYRKAIEINPGYISAKTNLAEAYLIAGHFNDAFSMANDLLKEKDISTQYILSMRFVSICSLAFQGKQPQTADQLKDFIKYYKSIPDEYKRTWIYSISKEFITNNKKFYTFYSCQSSTVKPLISLF